LKTIFILILAAVLNAGCNENNSPDNQNNSAKNQIRTRIERFLAAYESKDMNALVKMLSTSKEFLYFGSDIAEVNQSTADFQNQIDQDWKLFDKISFGEIRNLSIRISSAGDLAAAVYEIPVAADINGIQTKFMMRMSQIFLNENGLWQLVQGMSSIPSVGESAVELIVRKNSIP
jgi:ketosteroid isomerase-like protein